MKSTLRLIAIVLIVLGNCALTLWAQTRINVFAGVAYRFPLSWGSAGTVLLNDGTGSLNWSGVSVPPHTIAWSTSGSCPVGWTEYTTARGRYVVGLVASGTNEGTVGTALSDTENRATGQHNHVASGTHAHTQNAHSHTVTNGSHGHDEPGATTLTGDSGFGSVTVPSGSTSTGAASTGVSDVAATPTNQAATTGVSVNNSGSVAGTNAPYLQLMTCQKN